MTSPAASHTEIRQRQWICAAVLYGVLIIEGWREGDSGRRTPLSLRSPRSSSWVSLWSGIVRAHASSCWWEACSPSQPGGSSERSRRRSKAIPPARGEHAGLRGRLRRHAHLGRRSPADRRVGRCPPRWPRRTRWFGRSGLALVPDGHPLTRALAPFEHADLRGCCRSRPRMCLLVVLGLDLTPTLVRVIVCLTGAGLLATQSRGAYVAFIGACLVVPWRRYVQFAIPLLAGIVIGGAAIASSPHHGAVPWLGLVVVLAVAVSAAPWPRRLELPERMAIRVRRRRDRPPGCARCRRRAAR